MNWTEAVAAMQRGKHVRRSSQQKHEMLEDIAGAPVFWCGTEPTRLAAAWTDAGRPVMVFQGAFSKVLFVPEVEDMEATDWEIAP